MRSNLIAASNEAALNAAGNVAEDSPLLNGARPQNPDNRTEDDASRTGR